MAEHGAAHLLVCYALHGYLPWLKCKPEKKRQTKGKLFKQTEGCLQSINQETEPKLEAMTFEIGGGVRLNKK